MTLIDVVVTKYDHTVDFLYELGFIDDQTLVTDFANHEQVIGREVFGYLPLHMMTSIAGLWIFDIKIPGEKRGKPLSLKELREYVYGLSRYTVERERFDLDGEPRRNSGNNSRPVY